MKRFVLSLILISVGVHLTSAQNVGLKAGLNVANVNSNYVGVSKLNTNGILRFHVGVVGEMKIIGGLHINSGLIFSNKGYKLSPPLGDESILNLYYLDIPINLAYKFAAGPIKLYAQAGPYIGFALFGNDKTGEDVDKVKIGKELSELKGFDFGFGVGIGAEAGAFQLETTYQLGLIDWDNYNEITTFNRLVGISIAYFFLDR